MKVLFSVRENRGADSLLDDRFGRAAGFMLFDDEHQEWSWIDNSANVNATGGAGVQAAQTVVGSGAEIYIGAELGPKAMAVLSKSSLMLFIGVAGKSAQENYMLYKEGKIKRMV